MVVERETEFVCWLGGFVPLGWFRISSVVSSGLTEFVVVGEMTSLAGNVVVDVCLGVSSVI